jgi:anti-sigma28 factor (negative regulator of flagellin synthesis)
MPERGEGRAHTVSERTIHVNDLKASVEKASYVVDARAVAEALLRHVVDVRRPRAATPPPA